MPDQTEFKIPWGNDTITIKGSNTGIEALTVHFDDEQLNILDFLNTNLKAEYAVQYEAIMSAYEAKLKNGSIFDHNFPKTKFTVQKIDPSKPAILLPATDKKLIEALFKEYNACLDYIKEQFKKYETAVEKWLDNLPVTDKKT
jgi:hypothetical protein